MRKSSAYIFAAHVLTFAALLAWSWRKWPDPLVDFGRELYFAWQINEGRVLYRDLASLFGPLSPYINALWFRLFGTSLLTLAWCNTAIFAATIAGIYHLVRIPTDRMTATAASLSAVVLFGFSQYLDVGNYNFVTPYSHEATHGVALSVAALAALHYGLSRPSRRYCAVAGWCFGLTLLTKPDIAIASAAGMIAGWVTAFVVESHERSHFAASVLIFVTAAVAPSLLFFLYFVTQMSPGQALLGTGGAFAPLFSTGITANDFYRLGMGLDAPVRRASMMVFNFAGFVAFVALAIAISSSGAIANKLTQALRIGLIIGVFFALSKGTFPTALPLVVLTLLTAAIMLVARHRVDRERAFQQLPLVMWSAFAFVLLAKMGLYARFLHYGFYLALPATVGAITLTIGVIPQALATWRSDAAARGFRQLEFYALLAVVAPYVGLSHGWLRTKTISIGSGSDRLYASTMVPQGLLMRYAMNAVEQSTDSGTTLAVMPEGVMLNYLLRRHSPLRVVTLMPPELMAFGENNILASLVSNPPDVVVLIERDVAEYGYPPFGADRRYGLEIVSWVNEHYEPVRSVQDARILRRRR